MVNTLHSQGDYLLLHTLSRAHNLLFERDIRKPYVYSGRLPMWHGDITSIVFLTVGADPNESQATLVNNDGNAVA